MYRYRHGGNARTEPYENGFLDLSANINPLGPPLRVEGAIQKAIENIDRYPDNFSRELHRRIAGFEGVRPEWVFCTAGSSDLIFRLPRSVCAKTGLVLKPTFSDYARSLEANGCAVRFHRLKEETGFICDEYISLDRTDVLFFCNPNSPTGILTDRDFIEGLLRHAREAGTTVVVDECFMDFCEEATETTVKPLLERYDNLVLVKAFTKIFALPGIRLGYAICPNLETIDRLRFHGPDWPVSNLAQSAGVAALENASDFIRNTVEYVAAERAFLRNELETLGYGVFDGRANFLLAKNPYDFDLKVELDRHSIRIRSFETDEGLGKNYFRIGISTRKNNRRFLDAVRSVTRTRGARR